MNGSSGRLSAAFVAVSFQIEAHRLDLLACLVYFTLTAAKLVFNSSGNVGQWPLELRNSKNCKVNLATRRRTRHLLRTRARQIPGGRMSHSLSDAHAQYRHTSLWTINSMSFQ